MRFRVAVAWPAILVRGSKPHGLERLPSLSRGIRLTGVIDLLTVKRRREEILRLASHGYGYQAEERELFHRARVSYSIRVFR